MSLIFVASGIIKVLEEPIVEVSYLEGTEKLAQCTTIPKRRLFALLNLLQASRAGILYWSKNSIILTGSFYKNLFGAEPQLPPTEKNPGRVVSCSVLNEVILHRENRRAKEKFEGGGVGR